MITVPGGVRLFQSVACSMFVVSIATPASAVPPFQACGFKIGEVDSDSAIVWTRLTLQSVANPKDGPMYEIVEEPYKAGSQPDYPPNHPNKSRLSVKRRHSIYPVGVTVADIRDAVPGVAGEVRVGYRFDASKEWTWSQWRSVDGERDYTHQFQLADLKPNSRYHLSVESQNEDGEGESTEGGFRTAALPGSAADVLFTVSTGQQFFHQDSDEGYRIYDTMAQLDPSFFVHTGDIIYYDRLTTSLAEARYHWQRMYSLPTNVRFHQRVASYFIKDDHDTYTNDCWATLKTGYQGDFTFAQGLGVFREQVPMGKETFRTIRWGSDLQIWLVEGRDFRSPNTAADGPEKTIWGVAQKQWLKDSISNSNATFRILISPTPIVGPDRVGNKHDNHSNVDFQHEGDEIRTFLAKQENTIVICGDRHWQYHSVDPKTGIREYSCGPASDEHAGGWTKGDFRADYHRFLKVAGGFLSVKCQRDKNMPTLTLSFHAVDGEVRFADKLVGVTK
ncbi:MAG: alkaline phosphatase D family protein [Fuerstiella sp.]